MIAMSLLQTRTRHARLSLQLHTPHNLLDKQHDQQGLQLMLSIYQTAALGTLCLADQHPTLKARTSTLPQKAELQYEVAQLDPRASCLKGMMQTELVRMCSFIYLHPGYHTEVDCRR